MEYFFHPTCRRIGKREEIDIDMDEVLATAKKYRVAMEIDCYPDRSDLRDAHAPEHFRFIPLGEAIARRGWATKSDILNTKNAKDLIGYLMKKKMIITPPNPCLPAGMSP